MLEVEGDARAVGDEAVAVAGVGGDLADVAAELHGGGQRHGRGLGRIDDLEGLHDVGGHEEVRAGHDLGPLGDVGDLVDIERGGVGEEQRAGLHDLVEPGEHLLLDGHALEHRLDHGVAVADRLVGVDGLDQRHALVHLLPG